MTRVAWALVALLAGACEAEKETPEAAAGKAECRKLMEHIFQITPRPEGGGPETDPARVQARVAQVPIEDLEQCATTDRKVIACLQAAGDVTALRACIQKNP